MFRYLLFLLMIFALLSLGGCSSDDNPTGSGGSSGRMILADPSFATDIQEIFERNGCTASNCHGTAVQAGLDLRAASSRDSLVNIAATQEAGTRVIPGDADNSYLIIKLEDRQTVGSQMPLGGTELDNIDLQNIKNWINENAKDN